MIDLKDDLPFKTQLSDLSALAVLHTTVLLLLLTHSCGGQHHVIGPLQPIVAMAGDNVILPCHVEPAKDVVSKAVEWARPELKPRFVHVRRDGVELLIDQNPSYMGRTLMSINKLKCGDISLKLSKVKLSDEGTYRCYIPELHRDSTVQLLVGVVPSPSIGITKDMSGAVVFECESKGSYPEPEVFWLDGEGNILSAGPTETVKGPDGLYTVNSSMTVEESHSNSFTCRVQQNNISHTRHIHIHVADNVFMVPSWDPVRVSISLGVYLMGCLVVVFLVWKCRYNQTKVQHENDTALKDKLMDQKKDLKKQRETITSLLQEVKTQIEENRRKLENPSSWDREKKQKKRERAKSALENRKAEHEELLQITERLLETTEDMIITMIAMEAKQQNE
ncbi:butyrophilin subfamily 1 member A1-like [Scomber japonicus]|uniref:butyrophilin subfamily 1 member A1-like n=1 Tax=Scomber japonicus TaxID=13676 RepID=UPI00230630E4|nr:butyrophilin subfamily 1 member A1-like [Scomber japonicus]